MIKIGVIGSTEHEKYVRKLIKKFPSFNSIFRASDNIYDAPKITKELSDKCDVLLYSGNIPYSISRKHIPTNLPAHYIPLKGESLYRAMYRLKNEVSNVKTLSVDTLTESDMQKLCMELNESFKSIHYDFELSLINADEVVRFHETLYKENKIQGVLTGLKIVADQLNDLGIPNEWILPTDGDITVSLERALLSTEQRRNLESQIVFGIIQIDNFEQLKRQIASEQKNQRLQLDIHRAILDYIESLDGYLSTLGSNEYMFVTTRGTFERMTQGYKYFPLITEIKKRYKVNISVGIGFGITANEAGTHAKMALLQSIDNVEENVLLSRKTELLSGLLKMTSH